MSKWTREEVSRLKAGNLDECERLEAEVLGLTASEYGVAKLLQMGPQQIAALKQVKQSEKPRR